MVRLIAVSGLLLGLQVSCSPASGPVTTPMDEAPGVDSGTLNPDAPPETASLGRLVGVWDVEQETRNRDGSWSEASRAEWRWYYILDGHAIQDDWIKPPSTEPDATRRSFGTNIRIYNPEEERWEMSWIDSNNRKTATYTAIIEGDTVIMSGRNASGREIRNTFFNISENSFEWVQQWTFDEGESWVPVSRIRASRRDQQL